MHDRISQYNVDITLNYNFLPTVTLDFSNLAFPAIISNFDPDMNYMHVFRGSYRGSHKLYNFTRSNKLMKDRCP